VHDDCRTKTAAMSRQLQALTDSAKDLQLEAAQPGHEDTPLTRHIRLLENRLDKAMIKFNEAQSIRKTYEQIVRRLKEERVGFDNQLVSAADGVGAAAMQR
jgi:coiled-coil domain-containing protein 151